MSTPRLALALDQIKGYEWRIFEEFASQFLVDDFPDLRTMASPSGDGGRDAILFTGNGRTTTAFQYSVAEDWKSKINHTAERVHETHPETRRLVYVTNRQIGAAADSTKEAIWNNYGFLLDILDKSYFLEREELSTNRKATSDALASRIVDPYLQTKGIIKEISSPLTAEESKLALLQIALDRTDDIRDRNLTRASFEALVISVLRGSKAETAVPCEEIISAVGFWFPMATELS